MIRALLILAGIWILADILGEWLVQPEIDRQKWYYGKLGVPCDGQGERQSLSCKGQ